MKQSTRKKSGTQSMKLGVSKGTFETRMKKLMREDLLDNEFKAGEFRGKIADGK